MQHRCEAQTAQLFRRQTVLSERNHDRDNPQKQTLFPGISRWNNLRLSTTEKSVFSVKIPSYPHEKTA